MTANVVTPEQVRAYHADGAVLIPGLLADWVDTIRDGIERTMRQPGPHSFEYRSPGRPGRFFNDFQCWTRIPEMFEMVRKSPAAPAAAALMRSSTSQLFHDHVLVKEPGTAKPTPWHQDAGYFFVDGAQTVNIWMPLDTVRDATLRLVSGSHLWPKLVQPVHWQSEEILYPENNDYMPLPDIDSDCSKHRVLEWPMNPGDVVAFHFRTLHGARGNLAEIRRRALSVRFVGDDVRYRTYSGVTVPPFPGHGMQPGQRLREDWFPVMWNGGLTFDTDEGAAKLTAIAATARKYQTTPAAGGVAGTSSPSATDRSSARRPPRQPAGVWTKLRKIVRRLG